MTREEAKSCIGTIEMLQRLAYNIHGVMDAIDADNCKKIIKALEQEPRCKDCKWWKDSDGKYRRGCGAESKCRINTDKVYQGEGYCYLFEPQESEVGYGKV